MSSWDHRPGVRLPHGEANVGRPTRKGGVPMGSFLRRILFAIKFADMKILFSDVFTPEAGSTIRSIRERLSMVAPFLAFDGDLPCGVRRTSRVDAGRLHHHEQYPTPAHPLGEPLTINYIRTV